MFTRHMWIEETWALCVRVSLTVLGIASLLFMVSETANAQQVVEPSIPTEGGSVQSEPQQNSPLFAEIDAGKSQQPAAPPHGSAAILILDFERFYASSAFSRRVNEEISAETVAIQAENDRIVAELLAEEKELTVLRGSLSADAFQDMAEAFDQKVTTLRAEPLEKERDLIRRQTEAQRVFLQAAQPILQKILAETGAAAIVDRRNTIMHISAFDITNLAIARTDDALEGEMEESLTLGSELDEAGDKTVADPGLFQDLPEDGQ